MSAQKIDPNLNVNQQESVAVTCRELPCFTNCPVLDQATRRKIVTYYPEGTLYATDGIRIDSFHGVLPMGSLGA